MKEGEQREYKDKTTLVLEKDWQQSPSITDFSLSNYPPHLKSFNLPFIITKNKLYLIFQGSFLLPHFLTFMKSPSWPTHERQVF